MSEEETKLEADAFVNPIYAPKDERTHKEVAALGCELGLPTDDKYIRALSSLIVACKTANGKGSSLIAYPGDANEYHNSGYSYSVARKVRDALTDSGMLTLMQKASLGSSAVFEFEDVPLTGRFKSEVPWSAQVREPKPKGRDKGKLMTRKQCFKEFGSLYIDAEKRVDSLNGYLKCHPLAHEGQVFWGGVKRIFNDGLLERGGRLYGDWQQMKEKQRLNCLIDGVPVAEIDMVASFLFVASALEGKPICEPDPYRMVPWVKDKETRVMCKRLVLALISREGDMTRFPQGMKAEYSVPAKKTVTDYLEPILDTFPVLRSLKTNGLSIMFRESEAILAAIETLAARGVPSYPVHDCLIVKQRDVEQAVSVLLSCLSEELGAVPWLTVGYPDGREDRIGPLKSSMAA